jgi:hypothetical protein
MDFRLQYVGSSRSFELPLNLPNQAAAGNLWRMVQSALVSHESCKERSNLSCKIDNDGKAIVIEDGRFLNSTLFGKAEIRSALGNLDDTGIDRLYGNNGAAKNAEGKRRNLADIIAEFVDWVIAAEEDAKAMEKAARTVAKK